MKHYVYIVECSDGTLYCGYTTDIKRRVNEHNSANGAKYTKGRRPVNLKYSEKLDSRSSALKREIEIKKLKRENKLKLINK